MTFDTNVIFSNLPEILHGAWVTILIWIVTTLAAAVLGSLSLSRDVLAACCWTEGSALSSQCCAARPS